MGQLSSRCFLSNDIVHAGSDTEILQKDDTFMDVSITSDRQLNASSVSAACVHSESNAASSPVCPTTVTSTKHKHWFLANMTEEHWERLNMMCIVSPSSS